MRASSLWAIQTRVDRLAAECQVDEPETLYIHWISPYQTCPACGYDLCEHARAEAVTEARAQDGPGAPPRRIIWYWAGDLSACPACGAALPDNSWATNKEIEENPGT